MNFLDLRYWYDKLIPTENFSPDVSQEARSSSDLGKPPADDLDRLRIQQYMDSRGLFLIHDWKFSAETEDQVRGEMFLQHLLAGEYGGSSKDISKNIVIRLHEHIDTRYRSSLLKEGKVSRVRYELGRNFSSTSVTKRNREDNFALRVKAYSPMLCLAEVRFTDDSKPLLLSRYVDFPTDFDTRQLDTARGGSWAQSSRLPGGSIVPPLENEDLENEE